MWNPKWSNRSSNDKWGNEEKMMDDWFDASSLNSEWNISETSWDDKRDWKTTSTSWDDNVDFGWGASSTSWDGKRDWETASTSWIDNVKVSARSTNDCRKKQRQKVSKPMLTNHTQYTVPYINTNPFF